MEILNKIKSFWVNKEWREMDRTIAFLIAETVILVVSIIAWIVLMFIDWKIGLCIFLMTWGNNISQRKK